MILRFGLLATLATALLAYGQGQALWPFLVGNIPLLIGLLLGLLGGAAARHAGVLGYGRWQTAWLALIALVWLEATGAALHRELAHLVGFGPIAIKLMRPYLIATTLLLGYVALLFRAILARKPAWLPLVLLFPSALAVLVMANPAGKSLLGLPLLAASGLLPWAAEGLQGKADLAEGPAWCVGPAQLVEMASLQSVGWGLVLSLLSFAAELMRDGLLSALIVGFGTGVAAWLFSGLLWGVADNLRHGRLPVVPLARLVFGHRECLSGGDE